MKYHYFVSFSHVGGFGNAEITLARLVHRLETIEEIESLLEKKVGRDKEIVVLNYQLMKEE